VHALLLRARSRSFERGMVQERIALSHKRRAQTIQGRLHAVGGRRAVQHELARGDEPVLRRQRRRLHATSDTRGDSRERGQARTTVPHEKARDGAKLNSGVWPYAQPQLGSSAMTCWMSGSASVAASSCTVWTYHGTSAPRKE
jgi:hypothetical protein